MEHLVIYGTLAPGRSNHHVIADIPGTWRDVFVRGHLDQRGWGMTGGFPGLSPDPNADRHQVKMFSSEKLVEHWERLDKFEGPDYQRVLIPVEDESGVFATANVYALSKSSK